ncbi:MAG: hypothetical protein WC959_10005 [Kiritimatiellales bacterium]
MNLHAWDWGVLLFGLGALTAVTFYLRRLTRSVADYIAANRCAGRYLLTMAEGAEAIGAITIVAMFEKFYKSGFGGLWWQSMMLLATFIFSATGWVAYRYRQTRALTLPQFLEMRYSHRFRIFIGILSCVSGIINYGIYPAISARFVVYFFGLPIHMVHLFGMDLNLTLGMVMLVMISGAAFFALMGGQVAVLITDFIQSALLKFGGLLVFVVLLLFFKWDTFTSTMLSARPGESFINPFDQQGISGFNFTFFAMMVFIEAYTRKCWMTGQALSASAKNSHELKMAGILGNLSRATHELIYFIIPLAVYIIMNNEQFAEMAGSIRQGLSSLGTEQLQNQMLVPLGLSKLLPVGIFGLFCTVIVTAALSTDNTCLLIYGSILVQDVIVPLRKKPLDTARHLRWIRYAVFGVSVFVFFWSWLFPLGDYILMYFQLTGAIYMGGIGCAVIGGLYWKRGTTAGAWAGMITGSTLAVAGIILRNIIWPYQLDAIKAGFPAVQWIQQLPEDFFFNGVQMMVISALCAITVYVTVSLVTRVKPGFEMDKMLHRGKYAVAEEVIERHQVGGFFRRLGITDEFTRTDKMILFLNFGIMLTSVLPFITGCILRIFMDIPDKAWLAYWVWVLIFYTTIAVLTTIWFTWKGTQNVRELICGLRGQNETPADDGRVAE